jgi:hypothetical protein
LVLVLPRQRHGSRILATCHIPPLRRKLLLNPTLGKVPQWPLVLNSKYGYNVYGLVQLQMCDTRLYK